jgi:isoprenylcysteine carboxyl methyltransferase (ICMT) family protein YpbQ
MSKSELTNTANPKSCTVTSVVVAGLLSMLASMIGILWLPLNDIGAASFVLFVTALTIAGLDIFIVKVHRRESTGLDFASVSTKKFDYQRVAIKLGGLYLTLALVGIAYWVFPEYHGSFYNPYWQFLQMVLPIFLFISIPYFLWIDRLMVRPREDGYYQLGLLILGKFDWDNKRLISQHFLGWVIKGFFLPLMFVYLCKNIALFKATNWMAINNFETVYNFTYSFIFTIDLVFVCIGYSLSLRLFDSHIRSSEPTMLGWVVALVCYQPFWSLFEHLYLAYQDNYAWGNWLVDSPWLYCIWGSIILIIVFIYSLASVFFGLRFSNLTNRGIITNGPYRWTKHPAYWAKNISWWLISVPFLVHADIELAARQCLMLAGLNTIYFLRARTEESHLSTDEKYVEYANWINKNGLFRFIGEAIPFFKYRSPSEK